MPVLRVIGRDGVEQQINAPAGTSLMEPLRDMDDGVSAICGGMCSCATCQVYVDEAWVERLPAAMSDETDMLRDLNSIAPIRACPARSCSLTPCTVCASRSLRKNRHVRRTAILQITIWLMVLAATLAVVRVYFTIRRMSAKRKEDWDERLVKNLQGTGRGPVQPL